MYEALAPLVASSNRILLISHIAPDGDAIGSLLGLYWLLLGQGKQVTPANQHGAPAALRSPCLPGWEMVTTQAPGADDPPVDLVIALDCSDLERLGNVYRRRPDPSVAARSPHGTGDRRAAPLVNIDHHVTNLGFGDLNLVDSAASSTCEMLFTLAQQLGWPLSPPAAQCLLTGIVTDTNCFRTSNVTPALLGMAQALMQAGASLTIITESVLNRRPAASFRLWGQALSAARLQGRIIWTSIPYAARLACAATDPANDSGLVSHLISAAEADIAALFSEQEDGKIDVSLRSMPGVDVSQVALSLGGGGHAQAAGCTLRLNLSEAQARVLPALQAALERQLGAASDEAQW